MNSGQVQNVRCTTSICTFNQVMNQRYLLLSWSFCYSERCATASDWPVTPIVGYFYFIFMFLLALVIVLLKIKKLNFCCFCSIFVSLLYLWGWDEYKPRRTFDRYFKERFFHIKTNYDIWLENFGIFINAIVLVFVVIENCIECFTTYPKTVNYIL